MTTRGTRVVAEPSNISHTGPQGNRVAFSYSIGLSDAANLGSATENLLDIDLGAALADWSNYITGLGTLVVQLNIVNTAVGRADGSPTSGVSVGTTGGGATLVEPSSLYELATGQHDGADTSDITINIDPTYVATLFLNPDPGDGATIPNHEIDAVSVFRHELEHAFGISGYYNQDGSVLYGGQYLSTYDQWIQKNPDGSADFVGPHAEAAYGGPVPLTTTSTTQNFYHLANSVDEPLGQDLMNGLFFYYGTQYEISKVDVAIVQDMLAGVTDAGAISVDIPCFLAGTRIATDRGLVEVQDLCTGDSVKVVDDDSLQPIVSIGSHFVDCTRHSAPQAIWPVRIAVGAFGPGRPIRDLWLSPDHAVYLDGVLIPVKHLINGVTIMRVRVREARYFHVELPRHAVLLAEGLPVESYLGIPAAEHADGVALAWEAQGCAPLTTSGPELVVARRWIDALARGYPVPSGGPSHE